MRLRIERCLREMADIPVERKLATGVGIGGAHFRIGVAGDDYRAQAFEQIPVSRAFQTDAPLDG